MTDGKIGDQTVSSDRPEIHAKRIPDKAEVGTSTIKQGKVRYANPYSFTPYRVWKYILVLVFITFWQIDQISVKPLAISGLRYFSRFQNEYGKAYYL